MFYIFDCDGLLVTTCDFEPNIEDLEARSGFVIEHVKIAEDKNISANPATKEIVIRNKPERSLNEIKQDKITSLNNNAEQLVNTTIQSHETPSFERQTWPIQADESIAYQADDSAPTPTLDAIATARNIDRILLINKTYAKAIAYRNLTSYVAGRRQAIEQQIKAADSIYALDAISLEMSIPENE